MKRAIAAAASIALAVPAPLVAQSIDFGDDTGDYARDGECDDSRFEGPGMTDTALLEADIGHDATDCRVAFEQKRVRLKDASPKDLTNGIDLPISSIDFGDDSGAYPNDGECDDARFVGEGMAADLVTSTIGRDAGDCKSAFENGKVKLNRLFANPSDDNPIDYGTNTASFADDGECDDIRFTGDYASGVVYLAEDIGRDANDCRAAVDAGKARWQGMTATPNYGASANNQ